MSSNRNTTSTASGSSEPSQIHGHYQFLKGRAEESIGNLTGSEAYKNSGKQDVDAAVQEMHAAANKARQEGHGPEGDGKGVTASMERGVGNAVGCSGLKEMGGEKRA